MVDLTSIKKIYFLGIGGIGMSAIARYFVSHGKEVAGYDKTPSPLTRNLEAEGIPVHYEDDPALIPDEVELVVYTPAVPKTLKEYDFLNDNKIPIHKRAEVLGMLSSNHYTIAVAGTHGKTSVSSLIAHLLNECGKNVTAFIGGIMKNYHSNCIISSNTEVVVVEADEFDRSFLQLYPNIIVITAIDPDHLDIYGSGQELERNFKEFAGQLRKNGKLIIEHSLKPKFENQSQILTYGTDKKASYAASNGFIEKGYQVFDLTDEKEHLTEIRFALPGQYNQKNAAAAYAVARIMDTEKHKLKQAIESYAGVERRFDIRLRKESIVYIDDYAHHPSELEACIRAVRTLFPEKKITGIFQPHLYSRTKDFADGFAKSLDLLDEAILIPVYPARESPIEGVSSNMIYEKMQSEEKYLYKKEELVEKLKAFNLEVLLTLGAGDIDRLVKPITRMLEKNYA